MKRVIAAFILGLLIASPSYSKESYVQQPYPTGIFSPVHIDVVTSSIAPSPTPQIKKVEKLPTIKWIRDPEVSWYGPGFYGNGMACGSKLTTATIGVAHKTLPCGTWVEFYWKGHTVRAQVVDRGPYVQGRQFDLTHGLCVKLDHCYTGPIYYRII